MVVFPTIPLFLLYCLLTPTGIAEVKLLPLWELKHSVYQNLLYGYPVNALGSIIPTVKMVHDIACGEGKPAESAECKYWYAVTQCTFSIDQKEEASKAKKGPVCPKIKQPTSLSGRPFHELFHHFHIEHNVYSDIWQEEAIQIVENCRYDRTPVFENAYFCNWEEFKDHVSKHLEFWYNENDLSSGISVIYWYYFCSLTNANETTLDVEPKPLNVFCPNPCAGHNGPCVAVRNAQQALNIPTGDFSLGEVGLSNCRVLGYGLFEHDYECICEYGYEWSPSSRTCEMVDVCMLDEMKAQKEEVPDDERICSPKGTRRCIFNPHRQDSPSSDEAYTSMVRLKIRHNCLCYPEYMGYRCDRKRDACIENAVAGRIAGNQACRSFLGNKCFPQLGSNYYTCKCSRQWKHDSGFSFPNCYSPQSICEKIVCQNQGQCISSENEGNYICLCNYGWYGRHCELRDIRQWLPWGPWTSCSSPICGGMGWRSRYRNCRVAVNDSTEYGECVGNNVEYRPCRIGCPDPVEQYIPMIKLCLLFAMCIFLLQLAVGLIYLLLKVELS